jgi:lipopolysaccharide/colanic/teichoic acid biosynthesis glycosyltransferase
MATRATETSSALEFRDAPWAPEPADVGRRTDPWSTESLFSPFERAESVAQEQERPLFISKRILDICLIIATFPFWLPVMLLVTIWIKCTSPGPLFFYQERAGYQGKIFMILKFRTMKCNSHTSNHEQHYQQLVQSDGPMTKLDNLGDPRLIPGARLIRALGLDELPQLINVLKGDMSLVGPRPCTAREFQIYESWQRERFDALPGLTGWWQVNGKNKTTFSQMIQLDIYYARNQSLWLDLLIMLKTAPALFSQLK